MLKENNKWLIKKITKDRKIIKLGIFTGSSEFIKMNKSYLKNFLEKSEEINYILFIPMNNIYDIIAEDLITIVQRNASDLSDGLNYSIEFHYIERQFGIELTNKNIEKIIEQVSSREEVADICCNDKNFDILLWSDFAPNYQEEEEF